MFIYNVTTKVDWSIHEEWVDWMIKEHMPALIQTNCFTHFQLLRLRELDETDGPTYVAQYFSESKSQYNRYIELHAAKLRGDTEKNWGDKLVAFRSLMEKVH
jgi:hypothetical protein